MRNFLPEYVVLVTWNTVFEFENKLDHVLIDHPLRWNYTAEEGYKIQKAVLYL